MSLNLFFIYRILLKDYLCPLIPVMKRTLDHVQAEHIVLSYFIGGGLENISQIVNSAQSQVILKSPYFYSSAHTLNCRNIQTTGPFNYEPT